MTRLPLVLALALVLLLGACSSGDDAVETGSSDEPASETGEEGVDLPADATALLMAAALEELVTNDHTFGEGPPPFTDYLIQSQLDPAAGAGLGVGSGRDLSENERSAIDAAISPLGSVRFIDDPDEFRTDNLVPTIEGSAILGVDEPVIDGDRALVGVSLWCGGVCGTWLTYEIELIDGAWIVTGIDGPIAIS